LPVLAAQGGEGDGAGLAGRRDGKIDVSIRFYDKRIYYPGGGPVLIQVTVTNNGAGAWSFRLAEDREFSIDFDTRTPDNRKVKDADSLERRRAGEGKVFFRDITIESGEAFSFVEALDNYSDISRPGSYIVRLTLYPGLFTYGEDGGRLVSYSGADALVSNRLALHIRAPEVTGEDGAPVELEQASGAARLRAKLPPDEVVQWTLRARQKSQWEKYFLYLDLEKMIARDGAKERKWRAESEEGRRLMLAAYREALKKSFIDRDISAIPDEFVIENTNYNSNEAAVVALEKFRMGAEQNRYTELKRFTYYLEREDAYWMITDYKVENLGTE